MIENACPECSAESDDPEGALCQKPVEHGRMVHVRMTDTADTIDRGGQ